MAKNNHLTSDSSNQTSQELADATNKLGIGFLYQGFVGETSSLEELLKIAAHYSSIEKSMAVLSDLKNRQTFIYMGKSGETLGIGSKEEVKKISSIWEEEIFSRIPEKDLIRKHVEELKFYNFVKRQPVEQRGKYRFFEYLVMRDSKGRLFNILHRITYFHSSVDGSIAYAICLYNITSESNLQPTYILDMEQGRRIPLDDTSVAQSILSQREKDVLKLISKGVISKEIAERLSISIHTVNRHRQNILEKLQSSNSHEACLKAKMLGELE